MVRAASPLLLRIIILGAFFIYSTVRYGWTMRGLNRLWLGCVFSTHSKHKFTQPRPRNIAKRLQQHIPLPNQSLQLIETDRMIWYIGDSSCSTSPEGHAGSEQGQGRGSEGKTCQAPLFPSIVSRRSGKKSWLNIDWRRERPIPSSLIELYQLPGLPREWDLWLNWNWHLSDWKFHLNHRVEAVMDELPS